MLLAVCLFVPSSYHGPHSYPYVFEGIEQLGTYGAPPVDITLDTAFPDYASQIVVYKIIRPVVDDRYASNIAKQLGFSSKPEPSNGEREIYSYVNGDQILELGLHGSISLWSLNYWEKPVYLPSDEECIAIATKWLKERDLYPENVVSIVASSGGRVESRDIDTEIITDAHQAGTKIDFLVAIDGTTIDCGGVRIVIGDNGTVLRMDAHKYTLKRVYDLPLKDVSKAFGILKDTLARPGPHPAEYLECVVSYRSISSLVINGIELQYAYFSSRDYLLPIYVFTGDGCNELADKAYCYQFVGSVDAVLH